MRRVRIAPLLAQEGAHEDDAGRGQRLDEARRLIDISLDAGVTLFDTADVYSNGASETILGEAIKGRRDAVLISTKTGLPMGEGPQDWGASRSRLICAIEDALRRLGTDHIDLLQLHAFDASTPVDELMDTLATLIAAVIAPKRAIVAMMLPATLPWASCSRP